MIRSVAKRAVKCRFPLVIDPVMVSKHGASLLARPAVRALKEHLLPLAALITPNIPEAELLAGMKIRDVRDMKNAAGRILALGAKAVLVKGGHLRGRATDVFRDTVRTVLLDAERIPTRHTHGTGCTFSAAITAELAKGRGTLAAVRIAKKFITEAIRTAPGLGRGSGPVGHFAKI